MITNNQRFKIEKFFNKNLRDVSIKNLSMVQLFTEKFSYFGEIYKKYLTEKNATLTETTIRNINISFVERNKINFKNIEKISAISFNKLNYEEIFQRKPLGYFVANFDDLLVLISNFRIFKNQEKIKFVRLLQKREILKTLMFLHALKEEKNRSHISDTDLFFLLIFNKNIYHCTIINKNSGKKEIFVKYDKNGSHKNSNLFHTENSCFITTNDQNSKENTLKIFRSTSYSSFTGEDKDYLYIDIYHDIDNNITDFSCEKLFDFTENENNFCYNKNSSGFSKTINFKKIECDIENSKFFYFRCLMEKGKNILAVKNNFNQNFLQINYVNSNFFNKNKRIDSLFYLSEDKNVSNIIGPGKTSISYKIKEDNKTFEFTNMRYCFYVNGDILSEEKYLQELQKNTTESEFQKFFFKYFN